MPPEQSLPSAAHDWPAVAPSPRELADVEMILSGAFAPLRGFLDRASVAAVCETGRLPDGTLWPMPVTLQVPDELATAPVIALHDPEGTPVAALQVSDSWPAQPGRIHVAGEVSPLRRAEHGPFRKLRRDPAEVRAELAGAPAVLAAYAAEPWDRAQLAQLRLAGQRLGARLLVLPELGSTARPEALVRAILTSCRELGADALVLPVPLAGHGDPERQARLRAHVAAAYGATHLLAAAPVADAPLPVVLAPAVAFDVSVGAWLPAEEVPPQDRVEALTPAQRDDLLDSGAPIPESLASPALARALRAYRPPRHERGLTVFFTGLSGSGKSTIARGVYDALLERGEREVTLLDGDVVRRLLSAGLTFSRADRDLNIRRIGFVAGEVTRHGGVAICAPIAPYAATRAEVRAMVEATGGFVLVHVATPLAVCEQRDRKGLYAKARQGLIPEFTGISDPYEEPDDADLVLDTTGRSIQACVERVLQVLIDRGALWITG